MQFPKPNSVRSITSFISSTVAAVSLSALPAQSMTLHGSLTNGAVYGEISPANISRELPPLCQFDGCWQSFTTVTTSTIPFVEVGTCVNSRVRFTHSATTALSAKWKQDGWTKSKEQVALVSSSEAYMNRTNEGLGANAGYTEVSQDYYRQISPREIHVFSTIDMFEGPIYLGRYQTNSVLYPAPMGGLCHHNEPTDQTTWGTPLQSK